MSIEVARNENRASKISVECAPMTVLVLKPNIYLCLYRNANNAFKSIKACMNSHVYPVSVNAIQIELSLYRMR